MAGTTSRLVVTSTPYIAQEGPKSIQVSKPEVEKPKPKSDTELYIDFVKKLLKKNPRTRRSVANRVEVAKEDIQ